MLTAGIDVGTRFLKLCIVENRELLGSWCSEMSSNFDSLYRDALTGAMKIASEKRRKKIKKRDIKKIIATGYGAHLVRKAAFTLNDSVCIARGAYTLDNNVRAVVDAGGLFIRVVMIDDNGFLEDSYENEKCAAGSGKFLEMIAEAVDVPFSSVSDRVLESVDPYHISNSCAVFAESDVISQVNSGRESKDVLAGVINSIASKTATILDRADPLDPIAAVGGLAKVPAFREFLGRQTERRFVPLPLDSSIISAYGAAVIAQGNVVKKRADHS